MRYRAGSCCAVPSGATKTRHQTACAAAAVTAKASVGPSTMARLAPARSLSIASESGRGRAAAGSASASHHLSTGHSRVQVGAYRRCRDYMDAAIKLVRPGATTADIVSVWPTAQEFGFADEEAAFALQFGHGVGLSIWEKPIFSRLVSLDHPETLEVGMVFALETYWPASDGWGAARIEEELVVTPDGCEVITKFPAEQLLVAGQRYYTTGGFLPLERDAQSHRNGASRPGNRSWTAERHGIRRRIFSHARRRRSRCGCSAGRAARFRIDFFL